MHVKKLKVNTRLQLTITFIINKLSYQSDDHFHNPSLHIFMCQNQCQKLGKKWSWWLPRTHHDISFWPNSPKHKVKQNISELKVTKLWTLCKACLWISVACSRAVSKQRTTIPSNNLFSHTSPSQLLFCFLALPVFLSNTNTFPIQTNVLP